MDIVSGVATALPASLPVRASSSPIGASGTARPSDSNLRWSQWGLVFAGVASASFTRRLCRRPRSGSLRAQKVDERRPYEDKVQLKLPPQMEVWMKKPKRSGPRLGKMKDFGRFWVREGHMQEFHEEAPKDWPTIRDITGQDRRPWDGESLPSAEDLTRVDENGERWSLVRVTSSGGEMRWVPEKNFGRYRTTVRGIESKDEDGNWCSYAQMPRDVSHLTDVQIQRLVKELRGEVATCSDDPWEQDNEFGEFVPKKEVPPLEQWPFMSIDVTDDNIVTEEQMEDYKDLQMSNDLGKAFFLAARWKIGNEERRHLGYNVNDAIEDVANMNGVVLAYRCLTEQLKRCGLYRRREEDDPIPSDADRLENLCCTGLLGKDRGSAIALWLPRPDKDRLQVDLCLGDDCMNHGSYAEGILIRRLCKEARDLGLSKIWLRTRRTESGKIFVPPAMGELNFKRVPAEEQEKEVWDKFTIISENEDVEESVNGLLMWLSGRDLNQYITNVNDWCTEMGADNLTEVLENKEEVIEYLQEHGLTEEEKARFLKL
mmetsp:Transcript_18159/g.31869  ORF Transcript_18159/g.31869 Transcript_18159/m.31869 type:complete len:543 (-) Transcript_18159:36-1664(-)